MEWTDDKVFRLILLYEMHPCLYDLKSSDYHNRYRKKAATDKVAKELETTEAEVVKKWRYLRSQFGEEMKKVKRTKSGMGLDDAYISKWRYFDSLMFLSDHVNVNKATTSNLDIEHNDDATSTISDSVTAERVDDVERDGGTSQSQVQNCITEESKSTLQEPEDKRSPPSVINTPNSNKSGPPMKKLKKCTDNAAGNALAEVMQNYLAARAESMKAKQPNMQSSQTTNEDKDTVFAKLVEAEMRSIEIPSIKRWVRAGILNVISEGKSREEEMAEEGASSHMMQDPYGYSNYNYHQQFSLRQQFPVQPPPPPPPPVSPAPNTATSSQSLTQVGFVACRTTPIAPRKCNGQ